MIEKAHAATSVRFVFPERKLSSIRSKSSRVGVIAMLPPSSVIAISVEYPMI